ncbi:MAG: hypothetical protein JWL90_1901 [Chthoniobacteraceae bacterium]|nr:hypothetical protein [Chthoniobacteraceae bacterium]
MNGSAGALLLLRSARAAVLALEMNTSPRMIFSNYRQVVQPADAAAWWKIEPVKFSSNTDNKAVGQ